MGAASRPPRNRAATIVHGTSARLRPNRKPMLAHTATRNSLVSTVPMILRGSIRPDESNVGVEIGPHPPPPAASRNPAIRPRGAKKPLETGLTWTGRSCRLKEKRASTKTPSPNRKMATIGSAASAVMNELKTTAPKKAPIAPGIASGQTFAQSTFLIVYLFDVKYVAHNIAPEGLCQGSGPQSCPNSLEKSSNLLKFLPRRS